MARRKDGSSDERDESGDQRDESGDQRDESGLIGPFVVPDATGLGVVIPSPLSAGKPKPEPAERWTLGPEGHEAAADPQEDDPGRSASSDRLGRRASSDPKSQDEEPDHDRHR
jgi:hypothetical protein